MSFKTHDLHLSAFLTLNNCTIVNIELNREKGIFVFDDVDSNIISQYYMQQTKVEPIEYFQKVRSLTTLVRQTVEEFNKKGKSDGH